MRPILPQASHIPRSVCVLGTPVSRAKAAEPIEIPFRDILVLAKRLLGANVHRLNGRHGDAALCQVTLTTCLLWHDVLTWLKKQLSFCSYASTFLRFSDMDTADN